MLVGTLWGAGSQDSMSGGQVDVPVASTLQRVGLHRLLQIPAVFLGDQIQAGSLPPANTESQN